MKPAHQAAGLLGFDEVLPLGPSADAAALSARDRRTAALLAAEVERRGLHLVPTPVPGSPASSDVLPRGSRVAKRTLDLLGALALIALTLPVLLVAALAVKASSRGPVLFAQDRVGRGGRPFRMYKLRSMRLNNDDSAHRAYVAALIAGTASSEQGVYKLTRDPRVTGVGRVIRRFSVDELPQLWNVLAGDMSLVGPRPALPHEVELYDERAEQRLAVKPGITGLWQVSGRCELSFAEMIDLDVAYWESWSLRQDLSILLRTPLVAATGRGAA